MEQKPVWAEGKQETGQYEIGLASLEVVEVFSEKLFC